MEKKVFLKDIKNKKIAAIFTGGAAKSFCGLGTIRYFQENNIVPYISAGASTGSMLATISAFNIPWQKVIRLIEEFNLIKLISFKSIFIDQSIISSEKLKKLFLSYFDEFDEKTKIEDAPNKLVIYVVDPTTRKRILLTKGNLIDSVLASSSIPIIKNFEKVGNNLLADGDIIPSYSADEIRKLGAEFVIGISSITNPPSVKQMKKNIFYRAQNVLETVVENSRHLDIKLNPLDLLVEYTTDSINYLNFRKIKKMYLNSYNKIKSLLG